MSAALDGGDAAGGYDMDGDGYDGTSPTAGGYGGSAGLGGAAFADTAGDNGLISSAVAQKVAMDEADVDLLRNFGEHKLMDRVQKALEKQQRAQLARAEAELRAQQENVDRARKGREQAGVELYTVQSQLASVQGQLQASVAKVAAMHDLRTKIDVELKAHQDTFAARKTAVDAEESKLEKFRGELDGITDTLRQVETYTREMDDEIALSKRVGAKAGEEVDGKEKAKVGQDLYIDKLTVDLKRASEALALYEAQVAAQRAETVAAAGTMTEATNEMDVIKREKKALTSQWRASLVALEKRNEALAAIMTAIRVEQEALDSMSAEEGNIRKDFATTQAAALLLREQLEREEATAKLLDGNAATLSRQLAALEEQQEALTGQLEATEAEVQKAVIEAGKVDKQVREADRARFLVDKQRYGIEDEIAELISSRSTADKAAKALVKDARALIERVHAIEQQCADVENAIAGAKIEALEANTRISTLRDRVADAEASLKEKGALIAKYEGEVKQRADAIDKKMTIVARLNRRYEKLVADKPEAEHTGPLQAEVHNLQKATLAKREAIDALQKRWLMDQTALVGVANEGEGKSTRLRELQSQLVLLDQKRMRLDGAIEAQLAETKRLDAAVAVMHEDMTRINGLIARNDKLKAKLAAGTAAAEAAFSEELRALERDAAAAEARVVSQREEKGRLLDDVMECERQIVLWEKKIALERETQEALDPTEGESAIAAMERDINRMRARLDSLKRDQERLVSEMERAISKREMIAMKNRSASTLTMAAAAATGKGVLAASGKLGSTAGSAADSASMTKVGLKQRALTLQRDIEARLKQAEEVETALAAKMEQAATLAAAVKTKTEEVTALETRAAGLQRAINAALYEKQKGIETVSALSRMLQRMEALEAGRLPSLTSDEALRVSDRLAEAEGVRENVRRLVRTLSLRHSELADVLDRVAQLIDIAPPLTVMVVTGAGAAVGGAGARPA